MAAGPLGDFAQWLNDEPYWRTQIKHVHVQGPHRVLVYAGTQQVVLGDMTGYERKLAKLRTFLAKRPQEVQEKNYHELDLRFHGQVIGRYN